MQMILKKTNPLYIIPLSALLCFNLQAQKKDTITIIGVGDIMMGSNYPTHDLPTNDGLDLMKEVEPILSNADITFGNLEGVLLDEGGTAKTCKNPSVCYTFRSPERYVQNLLNAGFDLMSLANNHAGDFGAIGRKSSISALEGAGIRYAGLITNPYTIFEKDGVRYGFTAFAPNSGCLSLNDIQAARKIVSLLSSLADIVIVSFHGGAEGPQHQHVPRKNEIFYGEIRGNVYAFAHAMIDEGADILLGHGPHVTRAIEIYKNRFIAYSMGNFCTYGGINVNGINGWAPIIKVYTNPTGSFLKAHITSTFQTPRSPVKIDPQKQILKRIVELTIQDFPESPIKISENGWVEKSTN